jgi:hypothetical protein
VIAYPEPEVSIEPPYGEGAIVQGHAYRPDFISMTLANFLELQRGMQRITFQECKLFICTEPDALRQRIVLFSKFRGRAMLHES